MGEGGCWPTPEQELLLRAIVLEDSEAARRAWREWRVRVDFEAIDEGSLRLLPSLYRRLCDLQIDDPVLGRIKGLWRRTWYENSMRVSRVADLIQALRERGVETVVIKGLALALTVYRDVGERPMADADLLVPAEAAAAALDVLEELGLQPQERRPHDLIQVLHGLGLRHRDGFEVDLHWHSAKDFCVGDVDRALWAKTRSIEIRSIEARVPSPTHLLLHSLVQGVQWSPVPPIRWIADAAALLRSDDEIDWQELAEMSEQTERTLVVGRGLQALGEYALPVPASIVTRLERHAHSRFERIEMRLRESPEGRGVLGNLPRTLLHYRRLSMERGWARRVVGLPGFLRGWWQLDSLADLPRAVVRKAAERLRGTAEGT